MSTIKGSNLDRKVKVSTKTDSSGKEHTLYEPYEKKDIRTGEWEWHKDCSIGLPTEQDAKEWVNGS